MTPPLSLASSASSSTATSAKLACFFGSNDPVGREYPIALLPCMYSRISVTVGSGLEASRGWNGNTTEN